MSRKFHILLFGLVCFAIMAFQISDTTALFVREKMRIFYKEKMNRFHIGQGKKCQESAMEIARLQVDSVLSGTKRLIDIDTFLLLPRPSKPDMPDFDFDIDTLEIDPLFDKE